MKTLGAVRRGGGDAAWQQSGSRTVFALTGASGRAGPLLDLLAEVKDPDTESLAEAARQAGFISAETPLLLGVLEGTELVLFGAGGAVCRRLRDGESRDLLDPADMTSYSTGQTLLGRGDVLLCSTAGIKADPQLPASQLPAGLLDDLVRGDGLGAEAPAAVIRLGQPAPAKPAERSGGKRLLTALLLLLLAAALVAALLLLPWREAIGLGGSEPLLGRGSDVLLVGGGETPPELGDHLDAERVPRREGLRPGAYVLAETAAEGVTAVERIVILRDSSEAGRALMYLGSDLNYFQRGRTIELSESGAALQGPMLDPGQFALFADLPARRGGSMVLEPGAEPRDLSGGPPEDLPGPAFRAVVVR